MINEKIIRIMGKRYVAGMTISLSLILIVVSCTKTPLNVKTEAEAIAEFMEFRNIVAEPTESGLYYIELTEGPGAFPVLLDTVDLYYKGMFLDGRIFDTNLGKDLLRVPVGVGKLIAGLEEGLLYMKEGGEAMLIIPSSLAYGTSGTGLIPGNTPLLFEVEIVSLTQGPNHE